jgi:hypothetical protein
VKADIQNLLNPDEQADQADVAEQESSEEQEVTGGQADQNVTAGDETADQNVAAGDETADQNVTVSDETDPIPSFIANRTEVDLKPNEGNLTSLLDLLSSEEYSFADVATQPQETETGTET